jgi:hypothetical protein
VREGGSEARATWKKMAKNREQKNTAGEVVKRERRRVKVRLTPRSGQRRSRHWELVPGRKEKDLGKYEGKAMLLMWLRFALGYEAFSPTMATTPHPPEASLMKPAWMAALQMKESAR